MSSGNASNKQEKSKVFDMILCSPGMAENCKMSLQISRQNVLVLSRLIEAGILSDRVSFEDDILGSLPETAVTEFKGIHEEILKKAGLADFYEKLRQF